MKTRKVFVVGDSLFAETLAQLLGAVNSNTIKVIGCAPTLEAAAPLLKTQQPDAVIVASASELPAEALSQFLSVHPTLAILCADLGTNDVQVMTRQRVATRSDDLIKAIRRLPVQHRRERQVS
jgi:DNA-binding NarL/FixJ family response regulator